MPLNVNGLIGNYFGSALGKHLCFLQGQLEMYLSPTLFALFSCEATSGNVDIHLNHPPFPVVLHCSGEGNLRDIKQLDHFSTTGLKCNAEPPAHAGEGE